MNTIWKFPVPLRDEFNIEMPRQAEVLFVATQDGNPFMWARVNPKLPKDIRHFALRGTGHPIDSSAKYIGSFMVEGGALVFHLFEPDRIAYKRLVEHG